MKCFNQIVWRPEGDGAKRARVAKVLEKVLEKDAGEVKHGAALVWLELA